MAAPALRKSGRWSIFMEWRSVRIVWRTTSWGLSCFGEEFMGFRWIQRNRKCGI